MDEEPAPAYPDPDDPEELWERIAELEAEVERLKEELRYCHAGHPKERILEPRGLFS